MIRRGILSILLVALLATLGGWQGSAPQERAAREGADGTVALPGSIGATADAVVRARPDVLTAGIAEQRSGKARARTDWLPAVALSVLLAVSFGRLDQPTPGQPAILWRRRRTGLRAPPSLRLS